MNTGYAAAGTMVVGHLGVKWRKEISDNIQLVCGEVRLVVLPVVAMSAPEIRQCVVYRPLLN